MYRYLFIIIVDLNQEKRKAYRIYFTSKKNIYIYKYIYQYRQEVTQKMQDMGGDKDEGEQLTREKIKKASSTLATQHDKSKRKSKYKGKGRGSTTKGELPPMN